MNVGDTLLIGSDFSNGKDIGILTVGKQISGKVEIINAFQGKEAWDLFQKLTTVNPELKGGAQCMVDKRKLLQADGISRSSSLWNVQRGSRWR